MPSTQHLNQEFPLPQNLELELRKRNISLTLNESNTSEFICSIFFGFFFFLRVEPLKETAYALNRGHTLDPPQTTSSQLVYLIWPTQCFFKIRIGHQHYKFLRKNIGLCKINIYLKCIYIKIKISVLSWEK